MRIGIIGAGVIGQLRARSVREHPSTELAAVLDTSVDAAAKAAEGTGAHALTSLAAFLDVAMDAVIISSPVHVHEEACLGALERGRHVLCEKPLSNTVESCRLIVDAAIRADRILAVGFNLRYYPSIKFVKDSIDEGLIGDLDHLRVFGGHEGLPKFRVDWQYKAPESGGGAMMDVGIHMTDVARYLLGEITQVYGVMSESVWKVPGSEDNAVAVFRNAKGIPATYHATWTEWKGYQFYVEAYGNLGMVRGFYAPMQNLLITQDRPTGPRKKKRLLYPEIMLREKLKSWHSTALQSFRGELQDFLAMTEGRFDVPLADGYAGLRAVEVAAAVRKSSETGQVIHLPVLGRMHQ
ncbi:MAG: Gfo/Idh/MocA family oxidoreductase [Anaerolineae bacterium]|nr:Gfo/Idh/MocA family oxidoreductase [Gemmatimonadaceae bacterium]